VPSQIEGLNVFSLFSEKPTYKLKINEGYPIVNFLPKETILSAALRSGISLANSCRVGACASCKCKLINGKVKQLTDSSYVLNQEELDQGFILACQSIPKSNIEIEAQLNDISSP
jgi:3-phenylpropionate/trans-cinnamate dioxygenase ferredoxin reductase subunit